jgi:hypothetical protein
VASLRDGSWSLTGAKSVVCLGDKADALLVPAMVDERIAMFLVQARTPGVSTRGYATIDGGRAAELVLDHADATLLTTQGQQALDHAVDVGIACLCAEAVGVMERTVAITADYMNTRKQFGMPISSFQALRHRAADMKMQLELARSMSFYASLKLHLPGARRCAADPTRKRDDKAAMPALIVADLQHLWPGHPIKAGPVRHRMGLVNLAGYRGHQRDRIGFAVTQRMQRSGKTVVIHHVISAFCAMLCDGDRKEKPGQSPGYEMISLAV